MSYIDLTDIGEKPDSRIQFFKELPIGSSILVESVQPDIHNTTYTFIFFNTKKHIVRLKPTASDDELTIHLLNPEKQHGITKISIAPHGEGSQSPKEKLSDKSILLADATPTDPPLPPAAPTASPLPPLPPAAAPTASPLPPLPPAASPIATSDIIEIDIGAIEESDTLLYKEATVWELSYKSDTLIEDIGDQLLEHYEHKNINKSIDIIRREAVSILDLINKYKTNDDITNKTTISHDGDYKPLLDKIISADFSNSYISPIVFDQKKIYSSDGDVVAENNTVINHEKELQILNEILARYRDKKNKVFTNHKHILDKLYNGGNIELTAGEKTFFEGIYRSHTNTAPIVDDNMVYYKTTLKNNTNVFRYCFNEDGCDKINDVIMATNIGAVPDGSTPTKLQISTRLADGELLIIKDVYDDRYISDTKGEVKSCSSAGDKYYTGNDKSSDLNKTISKSPEYVKYVDGEDVNIVGFYIKAMSYVDSNIINGSEIIHNGGQTKQYSQLFNNGLTIMNTGPTRTSDKYKIINNYTEFDWTLYNPNYNYIIIFNNTDITSKLSHSEYFNIVSYITPSVSEIFEIEKDKIAKCLNTEDLGRVLNKHCIHVNQLSKSVLDSFYISDIFISNALVIKEYDEYILSKVGHSKSVMSNYTSLHNSLLQFKRILDESIQKLSHIAISTEYMSKITAGMKQISEPLFKLHTTEFLGNFLTTYLHSINSVDDVDDRDELIDEIILNIIISSSSVYSSSSFTKFFNNIGELIEAEYQELYILYLHEFNISINTFSSDHINNFDKNIKNHLDFIASIKNNSNNAQELIEIIDLSNIKKFKQVIMNSMNQYGAREYNSLKNKASLSWEELSTEEQLVYIPDTDKLKQFKTLAQGLKDTYMVQKEHMSQYLNNCKNIEIKKEYASIESLNADNSRNIDIDRKYDSTETDMSMWESINISDIEHKKQEFNKLLQTVYIFESPDNVARRYVHIIDIITKQVDTLPVKISPGDYSILHTGNQRLLYIRRGNIWVPVDKSQTAITQCYKYDDFFLTLDFADIASHCISYKTAATDDNRNKCIHTDANTIITEKLYKLHYLYDSIMTKMVNIGSVLKYYQTIDNKIKYRHASLVKRLNVLRRNNRKKYAAPIIHTKPIPNHNVYPPKNILNELGLIKRIDDFDQRGIRLKEFISTHGIQSKFVNGKQLPGDNWFFNIENVTLPLLCNHYNKLIDSVLMDESIKEANMNAVREKYGILDGEYYYCRNCGEVIDYQKYSEFEGFGKDDKVINVRESVTDDVYEESIEDLSSVSPDKITAFVNIVLRKIGVNLRVVDYTLIIETIGARLSAYKDDIVNLKDFYYKYIIPTLKPAQLAAEGTVRQKFENLSGSEYSLDYFKALPRETAGDIRKFASGFYKAAAVGTSKAGIGNYTKLFKGFGDLYIMSYTISTIAEVIRTAVPDYTIQGSGVEKRTKRGTDASGIIISDPYEAMVDVDGEQKLWILSYITDLIYADITSDGVNKLFKPLNNFLSRKLAGASKTRVIKKQGYSTMIEKCYQEIKAIGSMRDKSIDKQQHRAMVLLNNEMHITYDWDEFLPSLGFNNIFDYNPPDIKSIISGQIAKISSLTSLNKLTNADQISTITSAINDNNLRLRQIEGLLAYDLMTKINNIITTQNIPDNFNMISYTATSNYDRTNANYLDGYIKADGSISTVRDNMNMITNFFTKYNYNTNIIYDIVHTTHIARDLQGFMKLDRTLYDNDDDLVKQALVNKIKQSNYIYNLSEGVNYGELRYFKHVTDSDYYMVADAYSPDVDDISSMVSDAIKLKYGSQYPIENIEFKLKLLIDYNGSAEIDVISMEFKNDISNSVDTQVLGKSIDEINQIISEIEINTNVIERDTKQSHISIPNEIKNKHLVLDRLKEMLEDFTSTCGEDAEIEASLRKLLDIQRDIYTKTFTDTNSQIYLASVSKIHAEMSKFFNFCQTKIDNKISTIAAHTTITNSANILSNISSLDDYYGELTNSIDAKLKIEGITEVSTVIHEKQFRKNYNTISKFANRVNTHITIIRYIINLLSCFHNRLSSSGDSDRVRMSFLQESDKIIVTDILEQLDNPNKSIDTVIGSIEISGTDRHDFILPIEQFTKINNFINNLTMFNNSIINTGNIDILYINSPEVMVGFTNTIIIYLIDLLIDDGEPDKTAKVIPLIDNIIMYIKNTTSVNNVTDENIEFILGKHRADQNQSRLKRFQKKDKEEQGLHKIYRQYNLGNQITDDAEIVVDSGDVNFMTSGDPGDDNQFTSVDGGEIAQELYDEEGRDGLLDTAIDFDREEQEEDAE